MSNNCKKLFSKPINVYTKEWELIKQYNSLADLCRDSVNSFGERFHNTLVGKACKNKTLYKGCYFQYIDKVGV